MTYISTNLMSADMFTKQFTNKHKWDMLCSLTNLCCSAPKNGKWADLDELLALHRRVFSVADSPEGRGRVVQSDPCPLPEGFAEARVVLGWQDVRGGRLLVVREPVLFRKCLDPGYPLRSTWVRTLEGWRQVEARVRWERLSSSTAPLGV